MKQMVSLPNGCLVVDCAVRIAVVKIKTKDVFVWTSDEVELLPNITNENVFLSGQGSCDRDRTNQEGLMGVVFVVFCSRLSKLKYMPELSN